MDRRVITIMLVFVALTSGSYRMDEQFHPSSRIEKAHYINLPSSIKPFFFFKDKGDRKRFLTIAVIQQCVAYTYLIMNLLLFTCFKGRVSERMIANINTYYIVIDGLMVIAFGLFYKLYK